MVVEDVKQKSPDPESLKNRMALAGLSQRRAAILVDVNYVYLNQILNRKLRHPGYAVRIRLGRVLDRIERGDLKIERSKPGPKPRSQT